jgi:putative peptide zinc metalloprotease protein
LTETSEERTAVLRRDGDGDGAQRPEPDAAPNGDDRRGEAQQPSADGDRPRLADGIELLGEFEDSGYTEPHYVARRSDGQTIQLTHLLHVVAEHADGRRTYGEIAEAVSDELGRNVSADNVQFLVDKKLRKLGVLAQRDGSSPQLKKADPMLALRFRAALVPESASRVLTTIFYPLFFPPVIVAVLVALVAADIWFFFIHGVAQSTREMLYNPLLLLMVFGLVALGTAFHEIGHATALRYGGGKPGVMGAGIYIVWPAFYTDVTDAYRLGRWGRIRTDLGGVYFNAIFMLGILGVYVVTGFEPLLVLLLVTHLQMLQQFLPFLRLDGYYVVADLTGIPDLFARIKPTLKSAMPGKESDERAEAMKPWVRRTVTGWVLLLVPVLIVVFGMMIFNAPRMFATAYDSFFVQTDKVSAAFDQGNFLSGSVGIVQCLFLVLPMVGITYTFGRTGIRLAGGAWSWSEDSPIRRGAVAVVTGGLIAVAGFVLLPNGDYKPIQQGEKGTVQGGLKQFSSVSTGRPGLTEEREEELGEIVLEREVEGTDVEERDGKPTTTDTTTTGETGQTGETGTTQTTETDSGVGATVSTPVATATATVETSTSETTTVEAP